MVVYYEMVFSILVCGVLGSGLLWVSRDRWLMSLVVFVVLVLKLFSVMLVLVVLGMLVVGLELF